MASPPDKDLQVGVQPHLPIVQRIFANSPGDGFVINMLLSQNPFMAAIREVMMVMVVMMTVMMVVMMAFKVMLVGFCTQALFQPHLVKVQSQSSRNGFNVEKNRWYGTT